MGGQTEANHVQYQKDHINDNNVPLATGVYCLGYFLATVAVFLRFLSRRISDLPYMSDDWTILAAFIVFTALFAVNVWHVISGRLGVHAIAVSKEQMVIYFKSLYAFNLLYTNVIPLVKISILLLYKRLFPLVRVHQIIWFLIGLLVCFEISTSIVDIWNCRPLEAYWDKTIENPWCVRPQTLYMATAGINVATDVIILVLPMPLVWRLQLSTRRKLAISFVFFLGATVCVATIMRIVMFSTITSYDPTWTNQWSAYCTYSELTLAFICACVPTFTPVIKYTARTLPAFLTTPPASLKRIISNSSSDKSSEKVSEPHPTTHFDSLGIARQPHGKLSEQDPKTGFESVDDPNAYEAKAFTEKTRVVEKETDLEAGVATPNGIHVQRELNQTDK